MAAHINPLRYYLFLLQDFPSVGRGSRPNHRWLIKVEVSDREIVPERSSVNKKEAKRTAAQECLRVLGEIGEK